MSTHQDIPVVKCPGREEGTAEVHDLCAGAGPTGRWAHVGSRRTGASEAGMATAEYAIATLAAVGFAGVLVFIMRSDEVRGFLLNLIRAALALP
ncbi:MULTISPECIES: DUF4244 domain-containing protein [Arthrobacter]|uniref:DUF4244 domain-containing protein n=1 Tax=Arthrobacter oryzae TaxID=409290 RepID=A0A3N0C422_9MICC|nr:MULTISPECIES: DUF4244 domain-containing protein [Arthrobacter]QYF89280.1 DUF4244 domain-containing protein [Arthrobacter sp. PAMC25284]RNL57439.1 DUF4244 domain-containing protein [Arthrobacter oryzae]